MRNPSKIFLGVSVLLNILFLGVIGGHAWWYATQEHWQMMGGPQGNLKTLSDADQQSVDQAITQLRADTQKARNEIRAEYMAAEKILETEPFDKKAYMAQMHHIHALRDQFFDQTSAKIPDLAIKLPAKERPELLQLMHPQPMDPKDHH